MTTKYQNIAKRHSGFTLVEIMVGLAIGMLATLIIIQVISVFEAQKRVTTGTADAQTNGSIALYNIAREVQLAGYPLLPVADSPLECTTLTFGATGIGGIAPVTLTNDITASGVSASDSLTLRYGTSALGGIPTRITAMGAPGANDATVDNNLGCQVGDIAIISNGSTCALTSVTALSAASATPATITLENTTTAIAGANLACLGNWNEITYAVNSNNLERNGVPTVGGVVNLQAQYGISATASSNQVTQWVDADGGWAAPAIADRNRIKALRIAIVARSDKAGAANTTASCSSTSTAAPTGLCAWEGSVSSPAPTVDLSPGDANWQRYRYRVFETIIPLRNVIWAKDTL